jgi:nucleotide-binding universal stress UspA family protein
MSQLFSRLLLATEHTEFDSGAEAVALAMAKRCQLPLATIFPLVSNPEYEALAPEIAARGEREAAAKLAQLRAQAEVAGVALTVHVRRGEEPYLEIVQEASETHCDLLVTRRRGKRGFLANLLVGEMVSKVVAHAPCSVLIVPRGASMWQRHVLVAAEPNPQGQQVVATAIALARECGLPVQLVSVIADPTHQAQAADFVAAMLASAQQAGVVLAGEISQGRPHVEILSAAVRCQADLIIIASRSDKSIGRALVGGVAQKVIGLAETPVLVLSSATPVASA